MPAPFATDRSRLSRATARAAVIRVVCTISLLAPVFAGSACGRRVLFKRDDLRSQYDRYDRIRGEVVLPYSFDEFGRRKPNLSGRLERIR